ncbi:unnamed protein product [Mytilus coruscus]|uniref:Reverse transcriptase domain-containing protein n=1 Tax=Mytilus coruscus TaxID=42192 RepID=A0A6J8E6W8_MYTCO|nr:unnamed protein product [Mytilus coruscus]
MCSNSQFALHQGLMIAKSFVVVPPNHRVPIQILLNASNDRITLLKGKNIAEFTVLSNDNSYVRMSDNTESFKVQNIEIVEGQDVPFNPSKLEDSSLNIVAEFCKEFHLSDDLTETQLLQLQRCIYENRDLFVTQDNPDLGFTSLIEHKINLKSNAASKHQNPYSESEELPITSPVVLVTKRSSNADKKESQNFRFCSDFRHLNAQTEDFKYVISNLQELTESMSDLVPNFITSIDLSSGFFQMGISPDSTRYTAFNTCFGTYTFQRLPMGLKTAPNTFQLLMDKVLHGLKFRTCPCYLDDVLLCSETFEKHLNDLNEIFERFRSAGLKLGAKKCYFANKKCVFLGHDLSKDGIRPPKDSIQAITDYPEPKNIKQLRRLIGMFNWFRKFIPNFSALIYPLNRLLQKNQRFEWKAEQ